MSRYIDAEWLKELYQPYESYNGKELAVPIGAILANIDDAPTIDAVSVVRCKECRWIRYCETEDLDMYLDCDKPDGGGIPRNEDWFCADGERDGE